MSIMAKEKNFGRMVQVMQVHLLQVKRMGMEYTSGQTKLLMRGAGSTTK